MNWLTALFSGGDAIKVVSNTLEKLFTNDDAREKLLEMQKAQQAFELAEDTLNVQIETSQADVDKTEATNSSIFISGWRPAIGWTGAIALFYQFIAYPILCWIPLGHPPPAPLDYSMLYSLITGMLGIAGLRSYEKVKGVDTKNIN